MSQRPRASCREARRLHGGEATATKRRGVKVNRIGDQGWDGREVHRGQQERRREVRRCKGDWRRWGRQQLAAGDKDLSRSEWKEYTEMNEQGSEPKEGRRSKEEPAAARRVVAPRRFIQWSCGLEGGSRGGQRRVQMR